MYSCEKRRSRLEGPSTRLIVRDAEETTFESENELGMLNNADKWERELYVLARVPQTQ